MEKMKLKELINVKTGKLDANASSENGKYPFFTCSKKTLKIDTYSYDCECVLLAGNGDLNVKYYNGKFDAYQRTYILECKDDIISTKYLYYFMKEYLKVLRNQSIGGVIKYIKLVNITEAIIPIYSKEEQKRIVDNLSKVERVLDIKNKQIEELQNFIKSQFVEMFGDIKNSKFDINSIKKLVDINIMKTKKKHKERDIIKYVDISSIDNLKNEIISYKEYEVGLEPSRAQQCLEKGDILISTVRPNLKNIAVNNYEEDNIVGSSGFCVLRVNKCMREYLFEVVKTEKFTNNMILLATGANYPAIRDKDILDYKIAVPPITLQNQFVEIIKQIDKQKFESMIQLKMMEKIYNIINDRRRYV